MSNHHFIEQRKPDINYPCQWEYKVIGTDEQKLRAVILAACTPAAPAITLSNVSKKGTYFSLNATLQVDNEEMRLRIFNYLKNSPDVKIVI
ncbi:MAG: DUF493 domain-containing protein [Desulfofustis sp.]|jgi:uncharacterized protein